VERQRSLQEVLAGQGFFSFGDSVSVKMLNHLEALLQRADEKGIYVIGFASPFTEEIYEIMRSSENYAYFQPALESIQALFEKYDRPLFDFTRPANFGSNDEEFYDGVHPTTLAVVRMYTEMLRQLPDVLGEYSTLDYLEQVIENSRDPYYVFN
jgi:lysophospholipase L1-like esterase